MIPTALHSPSLELHWDQLLDITYVVIYHLTPSLAGTKLFAFCFFPARILRLKTESLQAAGRIIHPRGPTTCHHFRCICTDGVLAVAFTSSYCEAQRLWQDIKNEYNKTIDEHLQGFHFPTRTCMVSCYDHIAFFESLRLCSCWWQMLPRVCITQEPHGFAAHWYFLQRTRQGPAGCCDSMLLQHLSIPQATARNLKGPQCA